MLKHQSKNAVHSFLNIRLIYTSYNSSAIRVEFQCFKNTQKVSRTWELDQRDSGANIMSTEVA